MDFMKKIKNNFLFLGLFVCAAACTNNIPKEPTFIHFTLDTIKTERLPDKYTRESGRLTFQPFRSSNVYYFHSETNHLTIFDIDDLSLKDHLEVALNLDESAEIQGLFVDEKQRKIYFLVDFESIFIFDFNGALTGYFTINNENPIHFHACVLSTEGFIPTLLNNTWYFNAYPEIENGYKDSLFYQESIELAFDMETNSKTILNTSYPDNYKRHLMGFRYTPDRFVINNNTLAYAFPYNDSIFLFDIDKNEVTGSQFFGSITEKEIQYIPFGSLDSLHHSTLSELSQANPAYALSGYSTKQQLYYRAIIREDQSDGYDAYFILYDDNLQYLGESENTFSPGRIHDSKLGLISIVSDSTHIYFRKVNYEMD